METLASPLGRSGLGPRGDWGTVACACHSYLPRLLATAGPRLEAETKLIFRPEIRRDYPLNLSISLSGGKETNQDSPSNGE